MIISVFHFVKKLYAGESISNVFFFSTGIIIDTGICVIHKNESGPLEIISPLLNRVIVSKSFKK